MFDLTQSYDIVFAGAGIILGISGFVILGIPCQQVCKKTPHPAIQGAMPGGMNMA